MKWKALLKSFVALLIAVVCGIVIVHVAPAHRDLIASVTWATGWLAFGFVYGLNDGCLSGLVAAAAILAAKGKTAGVSLLHSMPNMLLNGLSPVAGYVAGLLVRRIIRHRSSDA